MHSCAHSLHWFVRDHLRQRQQQIQRNVAASEPAAEMTGS